MKKRILSVFLLLSMVIGLCACSSGDTVETIVTEEVIEGESNKEQAGADNAGKGDKSEGQG